MNERKMKYKQPQSYVIELFVEKTLLAGSGTATNDGYGDAIGDDDPNGWH